MRLPRKILLCLIVGFTGCSTSSRHVQKEHPGEWNAENPESGLAEPTRLAESPTLAPPPAVAPEPAGTNSLTNSLSAADGWSALKRWSAENGISFRQISSMAAPTFALRMTNGLLVLRANNLVATWNGMEFYLGFRPQVFEKDLFVHALDLKKNIRPCMESFSIPTNTNRVIVIDPGHGGSEPGTMSVLDGTPEKVFTLDWAIRLQSLLQTNGWTALLTRTNDTKVSLADRVALAERSHADLFVSLHFNALASPTDSAQAGIETYSLTPHGMPSTLTRGYADDTNSLFPNNAFDLENLELALMLHRSVLKVTGATDHGVRHARFMGVLRGQNRPAVLIEGGYLSNAREARRIAEPAYRQKLAEALAAALVQKPGTEAPRPEEKPLAIETNNVPNP